MGKIIFAQTRHNYESYADWHELIRLSGFDEIYIDEIPIEGVKENIYICTPLNGEWENGIQTDARVVCWDLEYRREPLKPIPGVSEIWHMDKAQADLIGAKYVPVGGHAGLHVTTAPQDLYDVAYYGYMIPRRQRIQAELRERGIRLSPQAAWGAERDVMLNASRAYLHIHQWEDIPAVPGLRMVVAAAYSLPFITEDCADYGVFERFAIRETYQHLVDKVRFVTHRPDLTSLWTDEGNRLHQFLCVDYTFRKSVEGAL